VTGVLLAVGAGCDGDGDGPSAAPQQLLDIPLARPVAGLVNLRPAQVSSVAYLEKSGQLVFSFEGGDGTCGQLAQALVESGRLKVQIGDRPGAGSCSAVGTLTTTRIAGVPEPPTQAPDGSTLAVRTYHS
jgi:hypothetical protein